MTQLVFTAAQLLLAVYLGGALCGACSTLMYRDRMQQLAEMTGRPAALISILSGLMWPKMLIDAFGGGPVETDPEIDRRTDRAMAGMIATDKLRRAEIEHAAAAAMYEHVAAAAQRFDRAHERLQALVDAHDLEAAAALYANVDLIEAVGARDLVLKNLLRAVEADDRALHETTCAQAAILLARTPARPEVVPMPAAGAAS